MPSPEFHLKQNEFVEFLAPAKNEVGRRLILPGSFNPLHDGHSEMARFAAAQFGSSLWFELSIHNVDKERLSEQEIARRCQQPFQPYGLVLTNAPTFHEKAAVFPAATFVIGVDTLIRIDDLVYYRKDPKVRSQALEQIAAKGVRFLVFARKIGKNLVDGAKLDLTDVLRSLCDFVPADTFQVDLSSTQIRNNRILSMEDIDDQQERA